MSLVLNDTSKLNDSFKEEINVNKINEVVQEVKDNVNTSNTSSSLSASADSSPSQSSASVESSPSQSNVKSDVVNNSNSEINLQSDNFVEADGEIKRSANNLGSISKSFNSILQKATFLDEEDQVTLVNQYNVVTNMQSEVDGITGNLTSIREKLNIVDPDFGQNVFLMDTSNNYGSLFVETVNDGNQDSYKNINGNNSSGVSADGVVVDPSDTTIYSLKDDGINASNGAGNSNQATSTDVDLSDGIPVKFYSDDFSAKDKINFENWNGTILTAPMGLNLDAPNGGTETWYDLDMYHVVENMEELYGHTNVTSRVREDGVKVISGTTPDGVNYEDLVMVAADVKHMSNPDGTFDRGQVVPTSLGAGIIVDLCGRSVDERSYNVHFDIATAWGTEPYHAMAYSGDSVKLVNADFVLPGEADSVLPDEADEVQLNNKSSSVSGGTSYQQSFGQNEVYSYNDVSADGIRYNVDVFGEVNGDTPIILLNHGGDSVDTTYGAGGDYSYYEDWLNSDENNKPNVVVIRYNRDGNGYNSNAYKLMEEVSYELSIPIDNCTTAGFSLGGEQAVKQMGDLLIEHPEIENPTVMIIDGYFTNGVVSATPEQLQALADSNAVLFNIRQNGILDGLDVLETWANEYGVNVVKVDDNKCYSTSAESSHHGVFDNYFDLGIINYHANQGLFPTGSYTNGNGEEISYYADAEFYDSTSGQWQPVNVDNKSLYDTYKDIGIELPYNDTSLSVNPVDVDSLLYKFESNWGEDDYLALMNQGYDLYDLYNIVSEDGSVVEGSGKEYITGLFDDMDGKYSGREAAVINAVTLLSLAADKGVRINYKHAGTSSTGNTPDTRIPVPLDAVVDGVDCNAFVSWSISKGSAEPFAWEEVLKMGDLGETVDYSNAKPGDILANGKHVMLVIENDPDTQEFVVAHASGFEIGIVMERKSYTAIKSARDSEGEYCPFSAINLDDFYGDSDANVDVGVNIPVQEKPPVTGNKPSGVDNKPPIDETKPLVEESKPPVVETRPSVEESKPPVVETRPSVEESKPPVVETKPSVEESKPPVVETKPSVEESKPPVVETKPLVEESKPPVVETRPSVEENNNLNNKQEISKVDNEQSYINPNNTSHGGNKVNDKDGASKYIVPGILATGLALISTTIGKFMKKNKDNNDV